MSRTPGAATAGSEPVTIGASIPLLVALLLAVLGHRGTGAAARGRVLWPCAALVTAIGRLGSLALLAFTGFAQIPEVAEEAPGR